MKQQYAMRMVYLMVIAFLPCMAKVDLTMKAKSVVYDFLGSLHDVNAAYVCLENMPETWEQCEELIVDPVTMVPLVKISHAPSWIAHEIYLDDALITSVRKHFSLSQAIKDELMYRVALITIAREKYAQRQRLPLNLAFSWSVAACMVSLEIAWIAWSERYPNVARASGALAGACAIASGILQVIKRKMHSPVDAQAELLDTIQKARTLAQAEQYNITS